MFTRRYVIPSDLTMSLTLIPPYEKATALGGVAAGNIKANDAAMPDGNIRYSG